MKRKQQSKYLLAIYTIVASLAIILWLLALYSADGIFQSTSLNLATELLGVVFIFFVVNYLFSIDEWDTNERIDRLLSKLEGEKVLKAEDFFESKPSAIDELIKESKYIDLCGVALGTTIDSHLSLLRDSIRDGANIRILIMENSESSLMFAAGRSESDDSKFYENKLKQTVHNLEFIHGHSKPDYPDSTGTLEVGFLPYPPSFAIKMFRKSSDDGVCHIEIFAHHVGWGEPPHFVLQDDVDEKWFKYFRNQFEAMWENSKKHSFTT